MLVIAIDSNIQTAFEDLASSKRMVFMTGLLGTGKSMLIQQLALIANKEGRKVHTLQYDLARKAFETKTNLAKYPEIDGVTDPAIRKAVGLWVRQAVLNWEAAHPEPEHMLIAELPLIGNRLIELVQPEEDALEPILQQEEHLFLIPIPSWEIRDVIENNRGAPLTTAKQNPKERDAAQNVLYGLWQEINALARQIGLTKTKPDTAYNPYIYGGVYEALLRHRNHQNILIENVLEPESLAEESDLVLTRLQATPNEVNEHIKLVEKMSRDDLLNQVKNWHTFISQQASLPDAGPELTLPLPESLIDVKNGPELSESQKESLQAILNLDLDASTETVLKYLEKSIESLSLPVSLTQANVHKFDVYDGYFNVKRSANHPEQRFLLALVQAYRNALANITESEDSLSVIELPLLRVALETSIRQFELN